MANTPLARKLGMKPGQRVLVLNAPEGYREVLGEVPEGVEIETTQVEGEYDFVQVFALDKAELDRLTDAAFDAVKRRTTVVPGVSFNNTMDLQFPPTQGRRAGTRGCMTLGQPRSGDRAVTGRSGCGA